MTAQPEKARACDARAKSRSLVVLLILIAITLGYLALDSSADGHGAHRASPVVTTVVIVLALVKVRLIFREFMQVRNAPMLLCRLTDLWVAVIGAALLASYFLGRALEARLRSKTRGGTPGHQPSMAVSVSRTSLPSRERGASAARPSASRDIACSLPPWRARIRSALEPAISADPCVV